MGQGVIQRTLVKGLAHLQKIYMFDKLTNRWLEWLDPEWGCEFPIENKGYSIATVDGSEIRNNHLGFFSKPVGNTWDFNYTCPSTGEFAGFLVAIKQYGLVC